MLLCESAGPAKKSEESWQHEDGLAWTRRRLAKREGLSTTTRANRCEALWKRARRGAGPLMRGIQRFSSWCIGAGLCEDIYFLGGSTQPQLLLACSGHEGQQMAARYEGSGEGHWWN
eukprot:scaffold6358_cov267-Pinguiococcus_pyrenoidosus.AAC.1